MQMPVKESTAKEDAGVRRTFWTATSDLQLRTSWIFDESLPGGRLLQHTRKASALKTTQDLLLGEATAKHHAHVLLNPP